MSRGDSAECGGRGQADRRCRSLCKELAVEALQGSALCKHETFRPLLQSAASLTQEIEERHPPSGASTGPMKCVMGI